MDGKLVNKTLVTQQPKNPIDHRMDTLTGVVSGLSWQRFAGYFAWNMLGSTVLNMVPGQMPALTASVNDYVKNMIATYFKD